MVDVKQLTMAELEARLAAIRQSPTDAGVLELIVRRPQIGAREVLPEGSLDLLEGLVGDSWKIRGSSRSADGSSQERATGRIGYRPMTIGVRGSSESS